MIANIDPHAVDPKYYAAVEEGRSNEEDGTPRRDNLFTMDSDDDDEGDWPIFAIADASTVIRNPSFCMLEHVGGTYDPRDFKYRPTPSSPTREPLPPSCRARRSRRMEHPTTPPPQPSDAPRRPDRASKAAMTPKKQRHVPARIFLGNWRHVRLPAHLANAVYRSRDARDHINQRVSKESSTRTTILGESYDGRATSCSHTNIDYLSQFHDIKRKEVDDYTRSMTGDSSKDESEDTVVFLVASSRKRSNESGT